MNTHRFSDWLGRLFDRRGPAPGMTAVDDVMPVVNLLEPSLEMLCGRGEIPFGFQVAMPAIAAQFARLLIDPPPNMLVRIDRIAVCTTTTAGMGFGVGMVAAGNAPLGSPVQPVMLDTRCMGNTALGPLIASSDNNAGHIVTPWTASAPFGVLCPVVGTFYDIPMPGLVLSGADVACACVEADTVNAAGRVIVMGMYRTSVNQSDLR